MSKHVEKLYVEVDAHFGETGIPMPSVITMPDENGNRKFEIERIIDIQPGCCPEIGVSGLVYRIRIPVGQGRTEVTKLYCQPVPEDRMRMRWAVARKV